MEDSHAHGQGRIHYPTLKCEGEWRDDNIGHGVICDDEGSKFEGWIMSSKAGFSFALMEFDMNGKEVMARHVCEEWFFRKAVIHFPCFT